MLPGQLLEEPPEESLAALPEESQVEVPEQLRDSGVTCLVSVEFQIRMDWLPLEHPLEPVLEHPLEPALVPALAIPGLFGMVLRWATKLWAYPLDSESVILLVLRRKRAV